MKRKELKEQTRQRIINKTALLLQEAGFLNVSSKDISRCSEVSQGTIFLHFKTKDALLTEIISSYLNQFEEKLKQECVKVESMDVFLKRYIDLIIQFEGMLSRTYKDFGYLPDELKKQVQNLDTTLKNIFFDNYRSHSKSRVNIIDTFIAIDAFYSQIEKYLIEKEVYTEHNSIIKQKRGRILKLYRILFGGLTND